MGVYNRTVVRKPSLVEDFEKEMESNGIKKESNGTKRMKMETGLAVHDTKGARERVNLRAVPCDKGIAIPPAVLQGALECLDGLQYCGNSIQILIPFGSFIQNVLQEQLVTK